MVPSLVSPLFLVYFALCALSAYVLVRVAVDLPPSAAASRAFRTGFPIASVVAVASFATMSYAGPWLFGPTTAAGDELPVRGLGDPPTVAGLELPANALFDAGLWGFVLALCCQTGLLAWLAVASVRADESEDRGDRK